MAELNSVPRGEQPKIKAMYLPIQTLSFCSPSALEYHSQSIENAPGDTNKNRPREGGFWIDVES
jgi:hypothetical protein